MKLLLYIALFLVVPMMLLNPLGRPAFIGYYAGVLACWAAFAVGLPRVNSKRLQSSILDYGCRHGSSR
jgi:hypothetical protein